MPKPPCDGWDGDDQDRRRQHNSVPLATNPVKTAAARLGRPAVAGLLAAALTGVTVLLATQLRGDEYEARVGLLRPNTANHPQGPAWQAQANPAPNPSGPARNSTHRGQAGKPKPVVVKSN